MASTLVVFWNRESSQIHLWLDLLPQGFGMASLITSTLIVGALSQRHFRFLQHLLFSLPGNDRWGFQRGYGHRHRKLSRPSRPHTAAHPSLVLSVTYLFRTTGQVLGVSLSGAVLQAVLLQQLRKRIQGPGATEVCKAKLTQPH